MPSVGWEGNGSTVWELGRVVQGRVREGEEGKEEGGRGGVATERRDRGRWVERGSDKRWMGCDDERVVALGYMLGKEDGR